MGNLTIADPARLYTTDEVAQLLRMPRHQIYRISHDELRRVYVGPGGRNPRYLGADLNTFLNARASAGQDEEYDGWEELGEEKEDHLPPPPDPED